MTNCNLKFGDLVWVTLPPQEIPDPSRPAPLTGHEQSGRRPAVCIFNPHELGTPRFELVVLAPLTSSPHSSFLQWPKLYPPLPADPKGLTVPSYVLLDQIRAVDVRRIERHQNLLSQMQLSFLKGCVKLILPK